MREFNISDNLQRAISILEELQDGRIYNEDMVAETIRLLKRTKYQNDESDAQKFRNVIRSIRKSQSKK
jgi:hypothetical protein